MTDADAKFLVNLDVSISKKFDPAYVTKYLTDDFSIWSDSISFLVGLPVRVTLPS